MKAAEWWRATKIFDIIKSQKAKSLRIFNRGDIMILADKIIKMRKMNGWSQEELADKMDVSRQAVSKWESAQSTPDLEKILQLSYLFGVSTDYLLKDELENEVFTENAGESDLKKITMEEANTYLEQRKRASWLIAAATFLCILSPITLIILGAASELLTLGISESVVGFVGLGALFVFVLAAVPIYIYCGFKNEPFAFLDKNVPFELAYGVRGMVSERQKTFRSAYVRWNIIATCLCIFAPLPLILSGFSKNEMLSVIMLALTLIIVGIGVSAFIIVGVRNASMQKLLREGEFSEKEKTKSVLRDAVGLVYWGLLTALYLAWSFLTEDWHVTWIVFAIGGILSPAVNTLCDYISDKQKNK